VFIALRPCHLAAVLLAMVARDALGATILGEVARTTASLRFAGAVVPDGRRPGRIRRSKRGPEQRMPPTRTRSPSPSETRPPTSGLAPEPSAADLAIATLGPCRIPSPLARGEHERFVDDLGGVLLCSDADQLAAYERAGAQPPAFERAGSRAKIYFDPAGLTCGIVTCGGLCPGLNNVVRAIALELWHAYGVRSILGFRYGYAGLSSRGRHEPLRLTPEAVEGLHEFGGTLLGSSRGPQDLGDMVDTLVEHRVSILFVIGGDGGLRGASALHGEIARRQLRIAVIGVPKTIDNDLAWTWRSFGFDTAVAAASEVLRAAHAEAIGALNGVGLVKLMGRHSGFIAAHATLASNEVNFCLVPEVPFVLEGQQGFLEALERRLDRKRHAVVAVAEGAGQELFPSDGVVKRDASGNLKLHDIGVLLRDRIAAHFADRKQVTIRYIDPSYIIRSQPADAFDAQFCLGLGQSAVHAGMAGRTNMFVAYWNQRGTHVPIALGVAEQKQIDPRGDLWVRVLETTGQPASLGGPLGSRD
jgi:6-phosphofructokinase 1